MILSEDGFTSLIPINDVAVEMLPHIAAFSSDSPSLDKFLCDNAKDLHCDHLSHTNLLFHEDFDGVAGYITMANDSIELKTIEVGDLGLAYKFDLSSYPAVKIGRLAVHKALQGSGVGKRILDLAIGHLVGAQAVTTARLMITDAVNDPRVINFYTRHGFVESLWATDQANNQRRGKLQMARATIKMIRDIYAA